MVGKFIIETTELKDELMLEQMELLADSRSTDRICFSWLSEHVVESRLRRLRILKELLHLSSADDACKSCSGKGSMSPLDSEIGRITGAVSLLDGRGQTTEPSSMSCEGSIYRTLFRGLSDSFSMDSLATMGNEFEGRSEVVGPSMGFEPLNSRGSIVALSLLGIR